MVLCILAFLLTGQGQNRPMDAIKSFKNHKIYKTKDCLKWKRQQFLLENRHKIEAREGPGPKSGLKNHGSVSVFFSWDVGSGWDTDEID